MIIRPHQIGFELGVSTGNRSPGLHMSDIYGDYYSRIDPKRYNKKKPMDMKRIEAGLALETVLERALAERQAGERPGEVMTEEGIAFSPDIIAFEGDITVLGEIKTTWMSALDCPISPEQSKLSGIPSNWDGVSVASFPGKFDKYMTQIMCYGYHLATPYARLYVYFVNGTYRPYAPAFLAWDLEFTLREQAEEWQKIKRHAQEVMKVL